MNNTLLKLKRNWLKADKVAKTLTRKKWESYRKASDAYNKVTSIESTYQDLFVKSIVKSEEPTTSDRLREIGRLLTANKLAWSVFRKTDSERGSHYRITIRGNKNVSRITKSFLGVQLSAFADDEIQRCLDEKKATLTYIVGIYEEATNENN
jgi:hypothetical protein